MDSNQNQTKKSALPFMLIEKTKVFIFTKKGV